MVLVHDNDLAQLDGVENSESDIVSSDDDGLAWLDETNTLFSDDLDGVDNQKEIDAFSDDLDGVVNSKRIIPFLVALMGAMTQKAIVFIRLIGLMIQKIL